MLAVFHARLLMVVPTFIRYAPDPVGLKLSAV